MRGTIQISVILLVLLAAVVLRSRDLFQPWNGLHKAWGGAMYGNIARNYLRYDVAQTRLAPITNTGAVEPGEFDYYYHYPPLLVFMLAASYRVFGDFEGAARLVPLAFSLASLGLLYLLARALATRRVAIVATIILGFMPVEIYYADHVDVYGPPVMFFSVLAIYAYVRWMRERTRVWFGVLLAAVVLGCLTAWYAYFVVPVLVLHAWVSSTARTRRTLVPIGLLPAAAVAVFGLFLLHRHLVVQAGGTEFGGTLLSKLLLRISYANLVIPEQGGVTTAVGLGGFMIHQARDLIRMFTPFPVILTGIWLVAALRRVRARQVTPEDGAIAMLLGFGFLHNLAFPQLLPGHDFMVRCYAPGMALASAGIGLAAVDLLSRWSRLTARAVAILVLLVFVGAGVYEARQMRYQGVNGGTLKARAQFVRDRTEPHTTVLVPWRADRVFQYYLERRTRHAESREALQGALRDTSRTYVLALRETDRDTYPDPGQDGWTPVAEHAGVILYRPAARP